MKIAFVCDVIYPYVKGGVEKRVWELAVRLAACGHEVHIFGMKYWEGDDILVRDGIILHGVCPAHPLYAKGRRTISEALTFSFFLFPSLMKDRFDLIDCQQFPYFPCITAKLVSILKGTPLVITWHEVWGDYWYAYLGKAGIFGKCVECLVSRLTSHVIAVSGTTAGQLGKVRPLPVTKVVPNGVDIQEIVAVAPAEHRHDILFAGRLIRDKHADLVIDSLRILSEKGKNLTLLIVGEGPEEDHLKNKIRETGLDGSIRICGFFPGHEELVAEMKAAKVFVLPSTREGFGISALEALACGLPVVTVDHPANAARELITEKTGFLCTLAAEDLAGSLCEALRHYSAMREDCVSAAAGYSWEVIAKDLEEYYLAVIQTRG